ncbi:hypothetical protein [Sphingomonas profundi]|uniref:hypothetical protein n=1 Tax=Alterirhizorhabdus profundi TaxID=2681549 RepID=UPI0012E701C7|nr:hypothetical protein [Sphingomonas profundi]
MIALLALFQLHMPSPADDLTLVERVTLVQAVTPYAHCINGHLPASYFDWPTKAAMNDAELRQRMDKMAETFSSCKNERALIRTPIASRKSVMFVDRLEDSYTYPVMLGTEPQLLIDPREAKSSNAPHP